MSLHTTMALKLHSFGLQRLHDPNWTGMTLFDELKQHVRGRRDPKTILFRTIEQGLLYHLGLWLYREYLHDESFVESLTDEYLVWYLEDYLAFLHFHKVRDRRHVLEDLRNELAHISVLYDESEHRYFEYLESEDGINTLRGHWERLQGVAEKYVNRLEPTYAADYADRVFHDRQLCGYIASLIVLIGFDGTQAEDDVPRQWIEREAVPEWAKKALYARERGKCATCGIDLISELDDDVHFDHIVPLNSGGCNDLVNLQMLCKVCNLRKATHQVDVASSVPPYMTRRIVRASRS